MIQSYTISWLNEEDLSRLLVLQNRHAQDEERFRFDTLGQNAQEGT